MPNEIRKIVDAVVPPDPSPIMQTALGFWSSKALLSAIELQVFTLLAAQPLDLAALQTRLGLHPRSSRDFFDSLVAVGFLDRSKGIYSNTRVTDFYLDRTKPSYIGGILEMANSRLYRFWGDLTTGLKTGEPQNEVKTGGDLFDTIYSEPARLKEFLRAMTGISRGANLAIASKFPWKKYNSTADIGTAQGDLVVQVALANTHVKGIGFDLPVVEPIFTEYVAENRLADRVQFAAGNFFEDPLSKADVLMMGHILHDWNLDEKMKLLQKAYEALPKGGALIVYDSIIDDAREKNAFGLLMSLNMLIETRGGFDYTGADCIGWMKETGFSEARVEHLVGPDSMVVGIK